jgi:DNA-binding SARP family transcriptional activator
MIRVETLGTVRISRDGEEIDVLLRQKLRCALLVYVAVEQQTTRELLASLFWQDRAPDKARHALSQIVYELRRGLGEDVIETTGDRVRVSAEMEVDSRDFASAIEREDFESAFELYRGPFLHGFHLAESHPFEVWTDTQAARLVRFHRRARRAAIHQRMAAGDSTAALAAARRWVEIDPGDDEAQHSLIQLLAISGDRTAALRQYERYERLIKEDDLEPLDATLELVASLRAGKVEPWAPVAESAEPNAAIASQGDLGHRADTPAGQPPPDVPPAGRSASPANGRADPGDALLEGVRPELEIVRLLGHGRTTSVYLARDVVLGRLVAVKVLKPDIAADETAHGRFVREARSGGRISHAHVTTVHRVGVLPDGIPYIVMEYVEGRTLAATIDATGPYFGDRAWTLLASVASALAAAHAEGIVHRDVRPANVFIERRTGRAVLADFGIAALLERGAGLATRLTAEGVRLGEPAYMSPEQVRGEPVTEQSDVYAFGILAYEVLTGSGPYEARNDNESISAHLRDEPRSLRRSRPDLDAERARIIERCLAKDPERRPFASEVAALLSGSAAQTGPSSTLPSANLPAQGTRAPLPGRRVLWIVMAATLLFLVVATAWVLARSLG